MRKGRSEIRNLIFYWEDKVSETAFALTNCGLPSGVDHNIPFDKIKQVEAKSAGSEGIMVLVTLASGREFVLTIPGSFRGESDFGQADVPAKSSGRW